MNRKIIDIILLMVFIAMSSFVPACQKAAPAFEVLSLNIAPAKVTTDQKATVEVEIRNSHAEVETYNVPLMVNGVADERRSVTLAPGATELITFTLTRSHPGTYSISVGNRESTLVVEKFIPPDFRLSNLEIDPTEVDSGEKVEITAAIANVGSIPGSYTIELKVDDCTVQIEKVILAAGADATLSFCVCADLPGTYEVTLGELTGKFTVAELTWPITPNNGSNNSASGSNSCKVRG